MRALLVVNQRATTTTRRIRDVLVHALSSEVRLAVAHTRRRGHGTTRAAEAVADGVDLVVALGGDGTVNEIVNGLLANGPGPGVPALAVVPGGSTNVFARALGLPRDWVEATGVLLEALREGRSRVVGLGRADDRYFTFCAGLGLDAEVVRRVEQARLRGHAASPLLYLRSAATQFLTETNRREKRVTLEVPGEEPVGQLAMLIVQNTAPWTYLNGRPVDACAEASFDLGLDVLAMRALHVPSTTRTATQLLFPRLARASGGPRGKRVLRLHDVAEFTVRTSDRMAFQLDGDYLGEREKIRFAAVPSALRVIY